MLSAAEANQNKLSLIFRDYSLELAFQAHHAKHILFQVRMAIIIAGVFYALFSILDAIVIPGDHTTALLVRFGFAIPLCILAYGLTYKHYFRKRLQLLVSGLICLAGIGIVMIAIRYESMRSDIFYMGSLLPIFWAFLYSGLRFVNAVKVSLCLILIYETLFYFFSDMSLHVFIGLNSFIFTSFFIGVLGGYTIERYSRRDFLNQRLITQEKQKNEKLLLNILPKSIAHELKMHHGTIARDYEEITVLFADLVGFTEFSRHQNAQETVAMLNEIFSSFDQLTDIHGLEKIKTIGDAYMVTSSINAEKSEAVAAVASFAIDLLVAMKQYNERTGKQIELRVGMHTGPAVAGVIGVKKFIYDVWGSTVNIASRMESHCPPNKIQVSETTYKRLKNQFAFHDRGDVEIKNMDKMHLYLLIEKSL